MEKPIKDFSKALHLLSVPLMVLAVPASVVFFPLVVAWPALAAWLDGRTGSYTASATYALAWMLAGGLLFGLPGLVLGVLALPAVVGVWLIRRGWTMSDGVMATCIASVVALVVLAGSVYHAANGQPVAALVQIMHDYAATQPDDGPIDMLLAMTMAFFDAQDYGQLMPLAEQYLTMDRAELLRKGMALMGEVISVALPSLLISGVLITGLLAWMCPHYALAIRRRHGGRLPVNLAHMKEVKPFSRLFIPRWVVLPIFVMLLAGYGLQLLAGSMMWQVVGITLQAITEVIFVALGCVLLAFWFERIRLPAFWRGVFIVLGVLALRNIVFYAGMFEFFLNLRRVTLLRDQMMKKEQGGDDQPPEGKV